MSLSLIFPHRSPKAFGRFAGDALEGVAKGAFGGVAHRLRDARHGDIPGLQGPFRQAHAIVGTLVRHCLATGTELRDVDAATLRRLSPRLTPDLVRTLTPARSVARRKVVGGTAPATVRRALVRAAREDVR